MVEPKKLSGPTSRHAVDEVFASLYEESPWLHESLEHMWRAAQDAVEDPQMGFRLSGSANPVMIVDELEKRDRAGNGGDPAQALLPLLQASTSVNFREMYLQAPIDLSRVSWILLANDLSLVPGPLVDRCAVFNVGYPSGEDLIKLVHRKLGRDAEPEVIMLAAQELEAGRMSLRGLDRLAKRIERILRQPLLN